MAGHATVTNGSMPVYFAHPHSLPHSPWERGSNENLNRIVREYFPKGEEITSDAKYLAMVVAISTTDPVGFITGKKPSEVFAELIESDASAA